MTFFCLVRHGQTAWNLEGRYQGQSDVPLNETGRAQAIDLARQLKDFTFQAIYSSDLQRARQIAEIVAAAQHQAVNIDARLREIHQGEWEGQLVDVIRAQYPDLWQQRAVDPVSVRAPGGETIREVADRMYAALDEFACLHPDGNILVVSHGLSLATVICKASHVPIERAYERIPENAVPIWVHWG